MHLATIFYFPINDVAPSSSKQNGMMQMLRISKWKNYVMQGFRLPFIIVMVAGDILDVFELVRYHAINTCKCYFFELSCDLLTIENPYLIFVHIELFYILCVKSVITQLHVNYKVCGEVHVHVLVFPLLDPRYQGLLAFVV